MEEQKPTIDERLAALAQSVELLSINVHAMQEDTRQWEAKQKSLDERERKARHAILAGIAAYYQTLNEGEDGTT